MENEEKNKENIELQRALEGSQKAFLRDLTKGLRPMVMGFIFAIFCITAVYALRVHGIMRDQIMAVGDYLTHSVQSYFITKEDDRIADDLKRAIRNNSIQRIELWMDGKLMHEAINTQLINHKLENIQLVEIKIYDKFMGRNQAVIGSLRIYQNLSPQIEVFVMAAGIGAVMVSFGLVMFRRRVRKNSKSMSEPIQKMVDTVRHATENKGMDFQFNRSGSDVKLIQAMEIAMEIMAKKLKDSVVLKGQFELELKKAEESRAIRTQFLAHVSHEIRNPLNAVVQLSTHFSRHEIQRHLSTTDRDLARKLEAASKNLLVTMGDILDFAKIDSGERRRDCDEQINLWQIMDDLVMISAVNTGKKDLKINLIMDASVPEYIEASERPVYQTVGNLIANAVKYTREGHVDVWVNVVNRGGQPMVVVRVEDTGPGIPDADRERIFQAFVQGDSTTTKGADGAGLGLTIAAEHMTAMGGTLHLIPSSEGAIFEAAWPYKHVYKDWNESAEEALPYLQGAWVVAHRFSMRESMRTTMERAGIQKVETFSRVQDALDKAAALPLEAAVMILVAEDVADVHLANEENLAFGWWGIVTYASEPRETWMETKPDFVLRYPFSVRAVNEQMARLLPGGNRAPSVTSTSARHAEGQDGRILLVEDLDYNRDVMKMVINRHLNVEVVEASSGAEALDIIASSDPFDRVVTDLHMPEMDGFELIPMIQELDSMVPITVVTGDATRETMDRLVDLGISDVFLKPYDEKTFVEHFGMNDREQKRGVEKDAVMTQKYHAELQDLLTKLADASRDVSAESVKFYLHAITGMAGLAQDKKTVEFTKDIRKLLADEAWESMLSQILIYAKHSALEGWDE